MIEWYSRRPKTGDKRIRRWFCLIPSRTQQDRIVWLDFIYLFQSYREMDYSWRRGDWDTEATLSPSQYRNFINDLSLNLIDPKEKIRGYAEIAHKRGQK